MIRLQSPAIAATRFRHQREQQHARRDHPAAWALGKLASLAGGLGAAFALRHAEPAGEGRILLTLLGLLAGIAVLSAIRAWNTTLTADAARLMLPLPLDPATRWRSAAIDAALATGLPAIALVVATALMAGWPWAVVAIIWLLVAWSAGTGVACTLTWSLGGGIVRWRTLAPMLALVLAIAATTRLLVTAPHPLSPWMLLPDALILGGLAFGPGAAFIGRAMIPVAQQVATAPPRTFAVAPRLTTRIANWLARHQHPAFAIVSKDLIAQSRDAFTLLRIVPTAGVLPVVLVLRTRTGLDSSGAGPLAAVAIALAFYGMLELRPSPFGAEGNRLLLALQSPISSHGLLAGKVLGVLAIDLPQVWVGVTLAAIGLGLPPTTWALAILATGVCVAGLGVILTAASVWDIDLERRVDDRTQAILAEHVPFGVQRMLGLGLTGAIAAASMAALFVLPMPVALGTLVVMHVGIAAIGTRLAIRRLTAVRDGSILQPGT